MIILSGQTYCKLWDHVNERKFEKSLLACGKRFIITGKFAYEEFVLSWVDTSRVIDIMP